MRENHSRHIETPLRKTAEAQTKDTQTKDTQTKDTQTKDTQTKDTQANKKPVEQRQRSESAVNNKSPEQAPLASAGEMNELGWSFRSRTTRVGPIRIFDEFAILQSSFDDRFAAVLEVSSVSQPSIIQRMMDPVGAIP